MGFYLALFFVPTPVILIAPIIVTVLRSKDC